MTEKKPAYMRIGKKGEPSLHEAEPTLRAGEPLFLKKSEDAKVCLLFSGTIGMVAKEVADQLRAKGIESTWASLPNIKPLNVPAIKQLFSQYAVVATFEEHSRIGGMGGALAELYVDENIRDSRLLRFGTQDWFLHETGNQEYARERYGLTAEKIVPDILRALKPAEAL